MAVHKRLDGSAHTRLSWRLTMRRATAMPTSSCAQHLPNCPCQGVDLERLVDDIQEAILSDILLTLLVITSDSQRLEARDYRSQFPYQLSASYLWHHQVCDNQSALSSASWTASTL